MHAFLVHSSVHCDALVSTRIFSDSHAVVHNESFLPTQDAVSDGETPPPYISLVDAEEAPASTRAEVHVERVVAAQGKFDAVACVDLLLRLIGVYFLVAWVCGLCNSYAPAEFLHERLNNAPQKALSRSSPTPSLLVEDGRSLSMRSMRLRDCTQSSRCI